MTPHWSLLEEETLVVGVQALVGNYLEQLAPAIWYATVVAVMGWLLLSAYRWQLADSIHGLVNGRVLKH